MPPTGQRAPAPQLEDQLQSLGLTPLEARVYLALVSAPKNHHEISKVVGAPSEQSRQALTNLAKKGLVRSFPGENLKYGATPPDRALAIQIRRLTDELQAMNHLSDRLKQLHEAGASNSGAEEHYVEIVFGLDAVLARLDAEMAAAQTEVAAFSKPPVLAAGNPMEEESLQTGVRHRAIYEAAQFEDPNSFREMLRFVAEGEEARVIQHLPSKLVIIDSQLAIMNVTEVTSVEPIVAALITRHPEVVETFSVLFETLWEQAIPVGGPLPIAEEDEELRSLASCLLAGMTDEAIARQMGVSRRTVTRHIQRLLSTLGVSTRFQAGFKIAATLGLQAEQG